VTWHAPSLKHKTILAITTQSGNLIHKYIGNEVCQDDDYFLIEGMNDFKVFLSHDVAQVKKSLEDAENA
jgi:hypothetical protein